VIAHGCARDPHASGKGVSDHTFCVYVNTIQGFVLPVEQSLDRMDFMAGQKVHYAMNFCSETKVPAAIESGRMRGICPAVRTNTG